MINKNLVVPVISDEIRNFVPPLPIQQLKENWPHLVVSTGALEAQLAQIKIGLCNYFNLNDIIFKIFRCISNRKSKY